MREDSVDVAIETEGSAEHMERGRPKPDGLADPAGEAGWYLQRERENRGETLEEAGAAICIHPYHLEAIEYGDMTHMPARQFALEMIGIYAEHLGFDPQPLMEHYSHFLSLPAASPKQAHPANPAPLSSARILKFGQFPKMPKFKFHLGGIPGGAGGLVATVAGAVLLFAGVSYMLLPGANAPSVSADLATSNLVVSADPMPTASTGDEAAEITIGDEPMPDDQPQDTAALAAADAAGDNLAGTDLDGISSLIEDQVPGAKEATREAAKLAAKEAAKSLDGMISATDMAMTAEGREFGSSNGESRVTLQARAAVWVRVEDALGNVVMTQMLMKGDTYRVPNREGLVVIARDGGLLSYVIDGKDKGILGTPGEILVGRSLDVKSFGGKG